MYLKQRLEFRNDTPPPNKCSRLTKSGIESSSRIRVGLVLDTSLGDRVP